MSIAERVTGAQNRFYLRIRDPKAWHPDLAEGATGLEALQGHKYCLLTTFRRSGEPVPTPVWFGIAAGRLYFRSEADVGKIKRIRNQGRVLLAPCNVRGKPLGPAVEGQARVLAADEEEKAESALVANYGLFRKLYEGVAMNLGPAGVYVEVAPGSGEEPNREEPV
jgi:PPOX class probable F420-dependent enzyme